MCVNAQGMCQRLEEPKSKIITYCMNLKRYLERWNKIFVQNSVRMSKMRDISIEIFMNYLIGLKNDKKTKKNL
jgi:hypothetical protein